jgi:hypothetical protein
MPVREGETNAKAAELQHDLADIQKEQDAYKKGWETQLLQTGHGREDLAHGIVQGIDTLHGRPQHTKNTTLVARELLQDETIWAAFQAAYPDQTATSRSAAKTAIFAWIPSIVRDLLTAVWNVLTRPVRSAALPHASTSTAQLTANAVLEASRYLSLGELNMKSALFLDQGMPTVEDDMVIESRPARAAQLMDKLHLSTPLVRNIVRLSQAENGAARGLAEQIVDLSEYIAVMGSADAFHPEPMSAAEVVQELTEENKTSQRYRNDLLAAAMKLCDPNA